MAQKISRATGGRNGRMPFFFQFSRNGRKTVQLGKKKSVKKRNNSTVNRICERFSHIGNINMNFAGVPLFNWKMLLTGPIDGFNEEAINYFCEMDISNLSNSIVASDCVDMSDSIQAASYDMVKEVIVHGLTEKWGSLEAVYPSLVKWLFTGENVAKSTHKQMFWRVFGDLVVKALETNLIANTICPVCGMAVPLWDKEHACPKAFPGFFSCVDCGSLVERKSSKQCRCNNCQEEFRRVFNNAIHARHNRTIRQNKKNERKSANEV